MDNTGITHVSAPRKDKISNSLIFINNESVFKNGPYEWTNCLILVDEVLRSKVSGIDTVKNKIEFCSDSRLEFVKLIEATGITKVYGLDTNDLVELPDSKNHSLIISSKIGTNLSIGMGTFIGAEDFCPLEDEDGNMLMFPQLGFTEIGNNVHVGHFSIVSRGALWSTKVGDDTKIDSYVQVGHNCTIGKRCIITANVIIGGSTTIGDDVFIGIGSNIRNGIHIGNNVVIAQGSNVVSDIPDNSIVMGNPAKVVKSNELKKNNICKVNRN